MPIGDLWQLTIKTSGPKNQNGFNVMYFDQVAGAGVPDANDFCNRADAVFTTPLAACMNHLAAVIGYRAQQWDKATNTPKGLYTELSITPVIGGVAGNPMPGAVAGIITILTSFPGKTTRGRFYVPFVSEGDNDNDQVPNAGALANYQALGDNFNDPFTFTSGGPTYSYNMVVYSRTNKAVNTVIDAIARNRWASQRKRQWNKQL